MSHFRFDTKEHGHWYARAATEGWVRDVSAILEGQRRVDSGRATRAEAEIHRLILLDRVRRLEGIGRRPNGLGDRANAAEAKAEHAYDTRTRAQREACNEVTGYCFSEIQALRARLEKAEATARRLSMARASAYASA